MGVAGHIPYQDVHVRFRKTVLRRLPFRVPPAVLDVDHSRINTFRYVSPLALYPDPVPVKYAQAGGGIRMDICQGVGDQLAQRFNLPALGAEVTQDTAAGGYDQRVFLVKLGGGDEGESNPTCNNFVFYVNEIPDK